MKIHNYTPPPGLESAMREGRCKMVWVLADLGGKPGSASSLLYEEFYEGNSERIKSLIKAKGSPYAVGDVLEWQDTRYDTTQPPLDPPEHTWIRHKITSVDCVRAADVTEEMARAMGYQDKGLLGSLGRFLFELSRQAYHADINESAWEIWAWIYEVEREG